MGVSQSLIGFLSSCLQTLGSVFPPALLLNMLLGESTQAKIPSPLSFIGCCGALSDENNNTNINNTNEDDVICKNNNTNKNNSDISDNSNNTL